MDKVELKGKIAEPSMAQMDDIPEALRDTPNVEQSSRFKPRLIIVVLLGLGAIALLSGAILARSTPQSSTTSSSTTPEIEPSSSTQISSNSTTEEVENAEEIENTDSLLGHVNYEEAPESDLKAIVANGRLRLRHTAADKFLEMQAAARANGISLVPISSFRSIAQQQHLFFAVKEQRGQIATKRAEVSAPPGYSEHHTGYAIDIGDGRVPATNLSPSFEQTAAFRWLEKNAAYYSFELSFPRNNPQGISYEPWHWRFVGDRHSLETFYKARNLQSQSASQNKQLINEP